MDIPWSWKITFSTNYTFYECVVATITNHRSQRVVDVWTSHAYSLPRLHVFTPTSSWDQSLSQNISVLSLLIILPFMEYKANSQSNLPLASNYSCLIYLIKSVILNTWAITRNLCHILWFWTSVFLSIFQNCTVM